MTGIENKPREAFKARASASLRGFWSDCSGSAAMEYIVAGAIISVGVITAVSALSDAVTELYGNTIAKLGGS